MRKKPGRHHLNLEAFAEPLSPEAKYWVGFLLADGCVSSNGNYDYIGLGLKFSDVEHVRKFARFVGVREESVRERLGVNNFGKNHAAQLVFSGKGLVPQLAKYGIVPRKPKQNTRLPSTHSCAKVKTTVWPNWKLRLMPGQPTLVLTVVMPCRR